MTISPRAVIRLPASAFRRWNTAGSSRSAKTSSLSCTAVATLLTFCPPGPEAAMKLSSASASARAVSSSIFDEAERGELGGPRRRRDDRRLALARHLERHGVEHRAPRALAVAVDRVAEQRDADARGRVDPQLMRAAGHRPEFDQRPPPGLGHDPPFGQRGLALLRGDHPPTLGRAADLRQRQLDCPLLRLGNPRENPEVALAHLPRLERRG